MLGTLVVCSTSTCKDDEGTNKIWSGRCDQLVVVLINGKKKPFSKTNEYVTQKLKILRADGNFCGKNEKKTKKKRRYGHEYRFGGHERSRSPYLRVTLTC